MSEVYTLNWKSFLFGAAVGVIGGYILSETLEEKLSLSGETVLSNVKQAFKKEGTIDGSWIQMQPENYQKYAIKTKVFRGGISKVENGERQQYEFLADAYTGTVIDLYPL